MTFPVGVNLLWLVPNEVGGSGEYTIRVLEALTELAPPELDLTLFVNTTFADDDAGRRLTEAHRTVRAPTSGRSRGERVAIEATWLRRQARRHRIELMHEGGGTIALWPPAKTLLTIHDLQPLELPENFSAVKRAYMRLMVPRSVRAATRISTLSEWVARDVATRLHVDPSRFVRVPPGMVPPARAADEEITAVVERYRLGRPDGGIQPFFFYPAITYPHKNHRLLVEAFASVAREDEHALLVLAGGEAQCEAEVVATIERLGLADRVRRTGRIPWRDVEVLYQCATALTFVSRYEGCGIPVLEAMATGCPVVASNSTGLPEMVGGAGLLVDPGDADAWSLAMLSLLGDDAERQRLVGLGRARAGRFDWATSAEALVAAYRAVADA